MSATITYVFKHDSIAVVKYGPTHEPIEQLPSLRAMPNLSVIRPADGNETNAAWRIAMEKTDQPTSLVLTRQKLPTITKDRKSTRLNSSHVAISYAVFCLKKKTITFKITYI